MLAFNIKDFLQNFPLLPIVLFCILLLGWGDSLSANPQTVDSSLKRYCQRLEVNLERQWRLVQSSVMAGHGKSRRALQLVGDLQGWVESCPEAKERVETRLCSLGRSLVFARYDFLQQRVMSQKTETERLLSEELAEQTAGWCRRPLSMIARAVTPLLRQSNAPVAIKAHSLAFNGLSEPVPSFYSEGD